jgi:leucyl aminopeptidase
MRVSTTTESPARTDADTVAIGVFEGEDVAHDLDGGLLQALVDSGEARRSFKHLAIRHAEDRRWLLVGLGDRARFDGERARIAAAVARARAAEVGTRTLCWEVPHHVGDDVVAGLVHGTVLAGYRFDRYKQPSDDEDGRGPEALVLSAHHDVGDAARVALVEAEAQNVAREWQDTPPNDMTPTALAAAAQAIEGVEVEVHGRDFLDAHGMGAFAAVTRASHEEPALIVARYDGGGSGPVLGLVGKAVTHDTGGLSLKPANSMFELKYDMTGGAVVLQALAAIARLGLPVRAIAVVGATENSVGGNAMRPADIVTSMKGITIEITNADAEGRLVLCDCLTYAIELGAERLVDVATLTGGVVTALGSVYAGLFANDDGWADTVTGAGEAAGELVWRLPLHPDYDEQMKSRYADLRNSDPGRKAHPIQAASMLRRFVGDVPWAHLDIAGVDHDVNRVYAPKGGTGWGVRLLVELARRHG